MKHAIVTGANGFVGSATVKCLIDNGVRVTALVHNGHADNLPESDLINVVYFLL